MQSHFNKINSNFVNTFIRRRSAICWNLPGSWNFKDLFVRTFVFNVNLGSKNFTSDVSSMDFSLNVCLNSSRFFALIFAFNVGITCVNWTSLPVISIVRPSLSRIKGVGFSADEFSVLGTLGTVFIIPVANFFWIWA